MPFSPTPWKLDREQYDTTETINDANGRSVAWVYKEPGLYAYENSRQIGSRNIRLILSAPALFENLNALLCMLMLGVEVPEETIQEMMAMLEKIDDGEFADPTVSVLREANGVH